MANHKSAKKRAKQTIVRYEKNKANRSRSRTAVQKAKEALGEKDKNTAIKLLQSAQSVLAKSAQAGSFHKKTASRKISRLATKIANAK